MSINAKHSVKCPGCGQMSDITVWNSITVRDSADLKDDLLRGRVNIFRCPSCGQSGLMPTPLLYLDDDKKLIFSFSPCDNPAEAKKQCADIKKASRETGGLKKYDGYNLRFITDFNALLEKILIFDTGFNDKAIEVIKLVILSQDIEKSDRRTCRFGKFENGTLEFMVHDTVENQIYTSSVPVESYNAIWESLRQSGVKPYSFDWEVVDGAYATKLLNGFNN